MAWLTPCLIVSVVLYGGFKGVDICASFGRGVKKGIDTLAAILPPILLMTVAIKMLEASGAIEFLSQLLRPAAGMVGLPADCVPLALIRPFSSAGALSVGISVMERLGVASYSGRVAAVMLGSSEASLYTIGLYSSATGIKGGGTVLLAAFVGDLAAFMASAFFVSLLM